MVNIEYVIFLIFIFTLFLTVLFSFYFKIKTNTLSLSIPLWVMLFWLFKGGIDFSIASISGVHLRFEKELFPVKLDLDYLIAYLTYFLYFFSYCIVCLFYCMSVSRVKSSFFNEKENFVTLNHKLLVLLSITMTVIYFYYGVHMYREALGSGLSIYHYSRFNGGPEKSIITLVSWIALSSCILAIGITKRKTRFLCVCLLLIVFLVSAVLGNRHILLSGIIFYFVLFVDVKQINFKRFFKMAVFFVFLTSCIMSIYVVREAQEGDFESINTEKVQDSILSILSSSEFIYPHMSMYGVLSNQVDVSYGKSLIFLVSALLPRVVSDYREENIYNYYIEKTSPNPFKGFTIANPTGWYLNFGMIGVLFGGLGLGLICSFLHFLCYYRGKRQILFFVLVYALFLSDIIGFMRSGGPEPYRAVLLIKSIIPAIIIVVTVQFSKRVKWS